MAGMNAPPSHQQCFTGAKQTSCLHLQEASSLWKVKERFLMACQKSPFY